MEALNDTMYWLLFALFYGAIILVLLWASRYAFRPEHPARTKTTARAGAYGE